MLESMTPSLLVVAVLLVALGWTLARAALTVGGQLAVAQGATGIDLAYELWARFGPLHVSMERDWDGRRLRLVVRLLGWRAIDRQLQRKAAEPERTKAMVRRRGWLRRRVEVDWLEFVAWALERRYLVAPSRLQAFVRFGLGDPARTGEVSGLLWGLRDLLPPGFELSHEAVFDREVLEAEGSGTLRLFPVRIASWLAWFVLSRVRFHAHPRRLRAAEEK